MMSEEEPQGLMGGALLPDVDDDKLESMMIAELDRALDGPPREEVPAGTILLWEGQVVDRIAVLLDGRVELTRSTDEGHVVVHGESTGRIIGLASLTRARKASFTVRAATNLTLLPIALPQLDRALRADPELSQHFVNVLIRSLARRHRRAVELQIENTQLARSLEEERDQLRDALAQLEDAQAQVVQSARMATLGEMAAGLAHELNNPVAALTRAAEHIAEDATELVTDCAQSTWRQTVLERAIRAPARSTAEHRRRRRELAAEVGDRRLAERLVAAGVEEPADAERLLAEAGLTDREALLDELERLRRLGDAVRNLRGAAGRVSELVSSLRSYARAGSDLQPGIDVREGLEDTLRLLNHRLGAVDVVRAYDDVPTITAQPGELSQAWTNIIANALDAMEDEGRLIVEVGAQDEAVRVRVADSGPGVDDVDLDRAFEPHFTTKDGRVAYGLGLGLSITRRIVERHGGEIALQPAEEGAGAEVVVTLPVRQPDGAGSPSAEEASEPDEAASPDPSTGPASEGPAPSQEEPS